MQLNPNKIRVTTRTLWRQGLALALWVGATSAWAATWIVGPDKPSMTLAEALAAAADGDTVALMPGRYMGQAGVVTHRQLTIRAVAERPVLESAGRVSERKAILRLSRSASR